MWRHVCHDPPSPPVTVHHVWPTPPLRDVILQCPPRPVSRVHWRMGLNPGQWMKRICKVWRGQNGWWWDGCAGCRWRIGRQRGFVQSPGCTGYGGGGDRGVADWSGLGIWYRPVEKWWQGRDVREGKEDFQGLCGGWYEGAWFTTWMGVVQGMNGRTSYRQK